MVTSTTGRGSWAAVGRRRRDDTWETPLADGSVGSEDTVEGVAMISG